MTRRPILKGKPLSASSFGPCYRKAWGNGIAQEKRKFSSLDEAMRHAPKGQRPYHCPNCKSWHLTSKEADGDG